MNNEKKNNNSTIIILIIAIVAFLALLFVIGIVVIFLFAFGIFAAVTSVINNTGVEIGSYRDEISGYKAHVVSSYEEYEKYFKDGKLTVEDFEKNNYYIFSFEYDPCSESDFQINNFTINSSNGVLEELEVGFTYETKCGGCAPEYMYYAIKLDKGIKQVKEFNYTAKARNKSEDCGAVAYKPMIYIYPDKDMNVEVKLGNSNLLTTTYPKYEKSWKVFAKTNGDLEYNGRTYYGLYWEGANHNSKVKDDGFVIKGEDTSKFLEEKLEILGLNEREINEFIIYWLPKMEHNKYNYIRFETREEIDSYMPLSISPSPQSVIRVYMDFKGLDKKIEVKEQQLEKNERVGYSVIEWGGSEIK